MMRLFASSQRQGPIGTEIKVVEFVEEEEELAEEDLELRASLEGYVPGYMRGATSQYLKDHPDEMRRRFYGV